MMQLGKLMNPMSGKIEKDLDGAQGTIDLLTMLRAKTEGNLSNDERSILDSSISSLQMNYVEEMRQSSAPTETDAAQPDGDAAQDEATAAQDEPASDDSATE
jgi:hypothetical protein